MQKLVGAALALWLSCGALAQAQDAPSPQAAPAPAPEPAPAGGPLPEALAAKLQEAQRLLAQDKNTEAEAEIEAILKERPGHEPTLVLLAELYQKTNRAPEAERRLREAVARPESDHRLALQLASLLERQKKPAEAQQVLEEAARRWPRQVEVHVRMGQFFGYGDMPRAEASYKAALALDPDQRSALNNLATIYTAQARHRDALALLEHNLQKNPQSVSGSFNLGSTWYAVGQLDKGIELHQRLLEKRPDDAFALSGLALGYLLADRFADADKVLQAPLQAASPHPLILYTQGLNLLFQGKPKEALVPLEAAWKGMTGRVHVGIAYAESLRQEGQLDKAEALLNRMEKDTQSAQSLLVPYLALLRHSQKRPAEAAEASARARKLLPEYASPADLRFQVRLPPRGVEDFKALEAAPAPAPSPPPTPQPPKSGCGCATTRSPPAWGGAALLLGLLLLRRRPRA